MISVAEDAAASHNQGTENRGPHRASRLSLATKVLLRVSFSSSLTLPTTTSSPRPPPSGTPRPLTFATQAWGRGLGTNGKPHSIIPVEGRGRGKKAESKMMRFRYHRPVPNSMWTTRYFTEPCFNKAIEDNAFYPGRMGANLSFADSMRYEFTTALLMGRGEKRTRVIPSTTH